MRARVRQVPLGVLAILCCAIACGALEQRFIGWNEASHFAQVRAFDRGTARIDRYRHTTGDRAVYKGHYYSDKAPGLALLVLPAYHAARVTGLERPGGFRTVHLLVLIGCVLPLLVVMLLAYGLVERGDHGQGTAVALTLALGTLLLPFSTLFFSHELSACLGFVAYCLLARERRLRAAGGSEGWWLIAAAGVGCGYAIASEYPLALLTVLLAFYVGARPGPARALLVFGAGVLVGVAPLLIYDTWAFGGPLHLSYSYVAANSSGVLGLGAPSLTRLVRLLVADRGLFVVTPVTAAGIAGIVVLWREGRRMDALVPAVVIAAYVSYNMCYYLPFGGGVPGPRFLVTVLPFLAVPLAAAYRRAPLATLALAGVSFARMLVATITLPILSTAKPTRVWLQLLGRGHIDVVRSGLLVFGVFAGIAIVLAVLAAPRPAVRRADIELAVLGVGTWYVLHQVGPTLLAHDLREGTAWGAVVLVLLWCAVCAVVWFVARGRELAILAGLPLLALAVRPLDEDPLACTLVVVSLVLLCALVRQRRVAL